MAEDNIGWIESIDPTSGRTFYANRYTRTTQWDPPPGWKNENINTPAPVTAPVGTTRNGHSNGPSNGHANGNGNVGSDVRNGGRYHPQPGRASSFRHNQQQQQQQQQRQQETHDDPNSLPDGWEEMTDPSTGRKFYIDHARKITTWERPTKRGGNNGNNGNQGNQGNYGNSGRISNSNDNDADHGFGFSNAQLMKLNQHGSHSQWDDDPRSGSRSRGSHGGSGGNGRTTTTSGSTSVGYDNSSYQRQQDGYTMGLDYHSSHAAAAGGPPPLDFVVVSVPDALRMECPGCNAAFTYTRRRHHCRLCGDVFCDACSSSRTILPLDGPEFDTPVRCCDWCMKDVKKGNYFSLRRYLTPLQLFDPDSTTTAKTTTSNKKAAKDDDGAGSGEATKEITSKTVAASLSSLSADIDAMMNEPTSFREKMTIPASTLIPAVGKHLKRRETAEYAIRVVASLLMLGNVVGDDSFAMAVYEGEHYGGGNGSKLLQNSESTNSFISLSEDEITSSSNNNNNNNNFALVEKKATQPCEVVNDVLGILEWNGNDGRTLSALEQAIKVIYYITEPNFLNGAISKRDVHHRVGTTGTSEENDGGSDAAAAAAAAGRGEGGGPIDIDAVAESIHDFIKIDIHRAFRSMLDHATSSMSPSLQRWAVASLRHLITEDQRRTCMYDSGPSKYESFLTQLVSTGGIMILCSLLSSEDAETRAHATSALEAIVVATREIGMVLNTASSSSAGRFVSRVGRGTSNDSFIVDAIVSNGGCGSALAHLLISSEESVAEMGCSFASSLISPLLTDPRGSGKALQQCMGTSSVGLEAKDDGLSSYRHAALALVVGEGSSGSQSEVSCLPSLIQIIRSGAEDSWGGKARSLKLQVVAGECLAAIALAVGHIVGAVASTPDSSLYLRARKALEIMEQERMYDVAFGIVTSASSRSLDPSRNTPRARLREAAGLTLLALSSCSDAAASYLISNKAVSKLLTIASESLAAPSALRGEWASRGLCYLETSAMLLLRAWKSDDPSCLNLLLDALDAGAVGLASRLVTSRVHLKHHDRAYSQMRIKIAVSYMLSAMFGIARADDDKDNAVGASRLYSAVDADCAAALAYGNPNETSGANGRTDLVASTVFLLSATLPYALRFANEEGDEPLPMMDLSEACILAVGGMCGAADSGASKHNFGEVQQSKFSHLRSDAAQMACKTLTSVKNGTAALLPSVLIGALGESLVVPALRLTLAMARNGHFEIRAELARSGMIVPVCDILQHSLSSGEQYTFSVAVAIVKFCGPCLTLDRSSNGSVAALQNCIQTLSCVLMMPESGGEDVNRRQTRMAPKNEALRTLEALSSNEALHGSLIDVFPSLTEFLIQLDGSTEMGTDDMVCSALKTIRSIISLPSSSPSSSVAVEGMIYSLVKILNNSHGLEKVENNRKREVSLELLHAIALGKSDGAANNDRGSSLLAHGALESVVSLLGEGTGLSAKMMHLGLDIVEFIIAGVESSSTTNPSTHFDNPSMGDAMLRRFVDDMARQEPFLRSLIATMIAKNDSKISISPLYGTPLLLPLDPAEDTAINLLFRIASILCSDVSGVGKESFLHAFMLKDLRGAADSVSLASCVFLGILNEEVDGICVPQQNPTDRSFFLAVKLPMIRSVLLGALSSSLDECMASSDNVSRTHAERLIHNFHIPQLCLRFCGSKQVFQAAFDLYENVVLQLPTDVLADLLLADKSSLVALFDLVTGQNDTSAYNDYDGHSKQTFALTLGNLAKVGALSIAVERFGVRNNAIAALSAAMQGGSEENIIDENEDSLPRICVESLAAILRHKNKRDELEITALEARIMATAIGKILSSTVLNRFFTQASLETTFHTSVDHSSDRSAISQSPEARLLCSIVAFSETLGMLQSAGGLEAVGLIAHEGELVAIRAIQKACESNPKSIVDVDAHLSIMDALIQVEGKLSSLAADAVSDVGKLREVAATCIRTIAILTQNKETKLAVVSSEQSFGCLTASACIVSARAKVLSQKSEAIKKEVASVVEQGWSPINETLIDSVEGDASVSTGSGPNPTAENVNKNLQLGDLVIVDSNLPPSSNPPSPLKSGTNIAVEGVVAHLGPVKFARGDDWIGIRLTGSSVGLGRNNGSVKGVHYFDCGDKNGVFTKRNNVKRHEREEVFESEEKKENEVQVVEISTEEHNSMSIVETRQVQLWGRLLSTDNDFALERDSFSLLLSFSSSKPHRDALMNTEAVINGMIDVIQLHSPHLANFQCNALDLLVSFTLHLNKPDVKLTEILCSVVESRTRVLQISRDKRLLHSTKEMLALAVSGMENIFCSFMDADEKLRSIKIASDLFIFLADSLFKGPKSRRLSASKTDGVLFHRLSSFFVLSLGLESLRASILSIKFVSSSIRFIMMAAGLTSFDCHIPITESEGGEYW
eukprot:CAMPEP_0196131176 /NCGR_PEP_ID=MMETSP0910-20130528/1285_1 /TAXON_ID=49265 /ORGANISM="Thalassiosira rotula, Strain GSO102" /LENGTH=2403 /DNA_ID=CAMNT_0041390619 /DNA_START=126 /DNA_END=7334 /DNA_ORIENTATION=+